MKQLNCDMTMTVLELWDRARSHSKSNALIGEAVLRRLFQFYPPAKQVFGYAVSEEMGKLKTAIHAAALVDLFDSVFQCLGPDVDFAEQILRDVAHKHKVKGVTPAMFAFMGQSFLDTFEELLGRSLSTEESESWHVTYEAISGEMIKDILQDGD